MATNILMPALSPTMTEGTLARWLKKEGDQVKAGDIIAEIETDKATMEVEAVDEGVLGRILVADGTQGVKVNDTIAVLVEPGEAVPSGGGSKSAGNESPSGPALEAVKADGGKVAGAAEQPIEAPKPAEQKALNPQPLPPVANGHAKGEERIFASPLARRMAQQAGLDLAGIQGSGPGGRIVKSDVEAALNRPKQAPAAQPAPAAQSPAAAPAPKPAAPAPAVTAPHTPVPNSTIREGHCPAVGGVEADHSAFLRDDGLRDRRAAEAAGRPQWQIRQGWAGGLQALGQ